MKKSVYIICLAATLTAFVSCGEEKKATVKNVSDGTQSGSVQPEEKKDDSDGAWFMAQTDCAPVLTVSATSELVEAKFSGKYLYPPVNILDGDFRNTWCESVDGDGIGESVTVELKEPVSFDEIQIVNGFATDESFSINNRIKKIMITQVAGEHFQQQEFSLEDNVKDWQSIKFKLPQTAQIFELKITEVYKGSQYEDTCLDDFRLLYKGRVIPFTGVEELKEIQEENSREMLSSDFKEKFTNLFETASNEYDGMKYVFLRSVEDKSNGIVIRGKVNGGSVNLTDMDTAEFYDKLPYDELDSKSQWFNPNREAYEKSDASTVAVCVPNFSASSYTVGNCRIVVTSNISYIETKTAQLIRIDGNKVVVNGVRYEIVPASTVFVVM